MLCLKRLKRNHVYLWLQLLGKRTKLLTPVSMWRFFFIFSGCSVPQLGFQLLGGLYFYQVQQSVDFHVRNRQFGSTRLSSQCWSKHLRVAPGKFILAYLSTAEFGKSFQMITSSIPGAQQNIKHDYIKTLVNYKWHL